MFYEQNITRLVAATKERIRDVMVWFPYPALISFFLVTIFVGHLIPSLNSRFGSPAQLITYEATKEPEGSIWISVYPGEDNMLHVKTIDREDFSWPLANPSQEDIELLVKYLQGKVESVQLSSGINNEANFVKTTAVIATDVKLNFYHIKPILYALSAARISNYGFETMLPGTQASLATRPSSGEVKEN